MVQWITLDGLVDYAHTLKLMEERVSSVIDQLSPEAVYLLEHKDTYTAGTGYKQEELLNPGGIPVVYTGRGGKFTYHGPGQRVIYPVLNLGAENRQQDLKLYVRNLERLIINTLDELCSIKAYTIPGKVGIWVNQGSSPAKIAAIGIRVKRWVTYHGIAVNISTNLDRFSGIIACGLENFQVTSLDKLGIKVGLSEFDEVLKSEFRKVFL